MKRADGLDVDYEMTRFFRRVREQSMGRLGEIHEELDYNSFLLFIGICDAPEGIRAAELAEGLRVHKSTVSRAVTMLEAFGLVIRGPHPSDGRAHLLTATDEAKERLEEYRNRTYTWLGALIADWPEADVRMFAAQLRRLNAAAEMLPSPDVP